MKTILKNFRKDFKEAVKDLEEKYNLEINIGNITYSDVDFQTKLNAVLIKDGKSVEQIEFEKYCEYYNLKPSDYNRKLKTQEKGTYYLIGFSPKARTYPYLARKKENNTVYKFKKCELI